MTTFTKWLFKYLIWYSIDLLLFSFIAFKIIKVHTIPFGCDCNPDSSSSLPELNTVFLIILIAIAIFSLIFSFETKFKYNFWIRIGALILSVIPFVINFIVNLFLKLPNLILGTDFSVVIQSNQQWFVIVYTVIITIVTIFYWPSTTSPRNSYDTWDDGE